MKDGRRMEGRVERRESRRKGRKDTGEIRREKTEWIGGKADERRNREEE